MKDTTIKNCKVEQFVGFSVQSEPTGKRVAIQA